MEILPLLLSLCLSGFGISADPPAAPLASPSPAADSASAAAAIIVHRQPTSAVVSIRLSVLASDPPGRSGAGLFIQYLVLPELRERMDRIGGSVSIERSDQAISYTLTGPADEVDQLTAALHGTLTPPPADRTGRLRALRRLRSDQNGVWETAPSHVRARLRMELFPDAPLTAGTAAATDLLREDTVEDLWKAMYRPDRVLVVAAGDVRAQRIRDAFAELPDPGPVALEGVEDPVREGAAPQSTRAWLGAAYRVDRVEPAVMTVLARLVQEDLDRALPDADVWVEHWWSRHGQAIAIVVAAQESRARAVQALLPGVFDRVAEAVGEDPGLLRGAARALWREMLLHGRSPAAMAGTIGRLAAVSGNPHEANRFHHALTGVRPRNVEDLVDRLLEAPAARVLLPPQSLEESQ